MKYQEVGNKASDVLEFLSNTDLKPEEKIAVLKTAASVIEFTLSSEALKAMYISAFDKFK